VNLQRLHHVLDRNAADGRLSAAAWAVARGGDVAFGTAGSAAEDTVFRISSMTKPVTAVAALLLVEECVLRLDEPVDEWLPELADRRVLRPGAASIDDETEPARRPITLADLLTFRLGLGMDFDFTRPQPVLAAMGELGIGAGPPRPQEPPEPDEFMRRLGTLPLAYHPGERWLYHTGADVLGVLIARAAGVPLGDFLAERVFAPLKMTDTAFSVDAAVLDAGRFGPCLGPDGSVFDPADGQWASPPAFPSGGAGLVSTAADYLAFGHMLLAGGAPLLSRASVAAMTSDHTGPVGGNDAMGWGFCTSVTLRRTGLPSPGSYGWAGGLGSSWANDPAEGLVGVVLTDTTFSSPAPPPAVQDFWTCLYSSI